MPSRQIEYMDKLIIGAIFIMTFQHATSQGITADSRVNSIHSLYYPVDTIKSKDKNSLTLNIKWMDSVIQIRKTIRIKYDLETSRIFKRDPTYTPNPIDTLRANEFNKTFSQNCHSYALEKYFKNICITDGILFTEWTVLTENKYIDKILKTAFKKTKSFESKNKKCKNCSFDKGAIIIFRNKWNSPIHTVYYDGQFHSKYGGGPARAENSINNVLKIYWDTENIEEYRLDDKKIQDFLNKKKGS